MDQSRSTAKDVFSHLLMIVTLYVAIFSFIALGFQYINYLFPDQLDFYYSGIFDTIRQSVAALVIVWPVYLFMSWLIARDESAHPEKREISVRKWLLYLTLFIAAITMIIDLVVLVFNFLGGEITVRFVLKVFIVLAVVGSVFAYYLWDLRRPAKPDGRPRMYAWIATSVLIIGVIAGFFIIGSPAKQREIRFDEQRINHLQQIQMQIVSYWQSKNDLPAELESLNDDVLSFEVPRDPENNQPYEYSVTGETSFELCAEFSHPSRGNNQSPEVSVPSYPGDPFTSSSWQHDAGKVCFTRTIDPDKFRPVEAKPLL